MEEPRASFNNLLVPIGVSIDAYAPPKKAVDKTGTYGHAVSHLLKSYATGASIDKATSDIGQPVSLSDDSAIQFADAVRFKAVRCCSTYPDERIKEEFINGLPLFIRSGVRMFCGRELEAHLLDPAQYANTLLDQQHGQVEKIHV